MSPVFNSFAIQIKLKARSTDTFDFEKIFSDV